MLEELVRVHNLRRKELKEIKSMGKIAFVVIDEDANIFGIYDEYTDAIERKEELEASSGEDDFYVEEYTMNKDFDPFNG